MIEDLDGYPEVHWLCPGLLLEEPLAGRVVEVVGFTLEHDDLFGQAVQLAHVLVDSVEKRDRLLQQQGRPDDAVSHLPHLWLEVGHVEEEDGLGRFLHLVDGIVHRVDQTGDVAPVERGDEGAPDGEQHLTGNTVALVLAVHDGLEVLSESRPTLKGGAQRSCSSHYGSRMLGEQSEETLLLGHDGLQPAHRLFSWLVRTITDHPFGCGSQWAGNAS